MALMPGLALAQTGPFAPAHDEPGTTAIYADSSAFVAWATGCVVEAGPMNIANPSLGVAGAGYPAENAIGVPDGTYGVACLGDGGYATLTFASPICNQPGPDFAVFENGFKSGSQYFLEIAFVEVSSDGEHFFRFPAITAVQYDTQLGGFATMDPSYIHNFAGKYAAFYGTPFELDDIPDDPLLNKNNITHVRVVDVVGSIDPEYCTYDSEGHPVNDPWPTPFASSGFDLDAVGVIHDIEHFPNPPAPNEPPYVANPVEDVIFNEYPETIEINLDGVVSDPDDPDENISYIVVSNSNENELTATMNGKVLVLTRLSMEEGSATLVIRATSGDQSIEFDVNVIMNFVEDGVEENADMTISVYPNPAHDFIIIRANNDLSLQCDLYSVTGQKVLSSTEDVINVLELESGVYFVRVNCGENVFTECVIIK